MNTTETIEGIDQDRRRLLGAVTMGIAVAGAASLSPEHFAAAADENTIRPFHPTRRDTMTRHTYDKEITALLVVDPYNDFISEGGKIWDRIRAVAEANDCVPHMLQVLNAARKAKLRIFYAMHHRYRPGDYETWKYIAPIQKAAWKSKVFEYGTWGGEIRPEFEPKPGEIVATEHWCSSGFANTDLDLQLKKYGIHQLIVIGLIAHTCIEATVRFAAELGHEVTVVKDATADYSDEAMHAALDINIPNYASAIVTTNEIVDSIST
jgi:nicotinamidase-related amidase